MIPLTDLRDIIGIALASAVVVGAIGMAALMLNRNRPLLVQLMVVVLTGIVSVVTGMIAVAQAMYLSPHDLTVTAWVAVAATLASLPVAVILARWFTRRSEQLRLMAEAIADGTSTAKPAAASDRSEMAIVQTELARTSTRLTQAREELDALERSRRELIAWISHDLRTPLAALRAMAEALEDGMTDDPQRFHRQMRSQVDHLSELVDDLFELSKIQSGRLTLSLESVSLYDLVSDAVAELSALAKARSITIRESPRLDVAVTGDPRELSRVIGNLLVNAIQYSPAGGEITVITRVDASGRAVLSVADAGGGIPEEDLSRIFHAGWRASASRTPEQVWGKSTNAGLGLAIVHGIVQAHGGEITVQNVPPGCRFDVYLPAA